MKKKSAVASERKITVALAGNPNVGKSTLFNSLTGMHVHTGNWAGKTVGLEMADTELLGRAVRLVDIPGTYSLVSHSEEERIAREYICFGDADVTVVVCDVTAIMQNLPLVLQIVETGRRVMVALNFADEAKRNGVVINRLRLSELLGVPVVMTVAHDKKSLASLSREILRLADAEAVTREKLISYPEAIDEKAELFAPLIEGSIPQGLSSRWVALRLIDADSELYGEITDRIPREKWDRLSDVRNNILTELYGQGYTPERITDEIVGSLVEKAEEISRSVTEREGSRERDRRLDKFLTGKVSAYPAMLLLLFFVLLVTVYLASFPSAWLGSFFSFVSGWLDSLFTSWNMPKFLHGMLLTGVFNTLFEVVSVMLPPMVIFFPLFALIEDCGYMPRIAYNLDRPFACAGACGKQALTTCMGFGCNAVGIVGCRIIDSKRERLLAILTNSLIPCNGKFPMLITLISVIGLTLGASFSFAFSALILAILVAVAIGASFLSTAILSRTVFRGERSAFTVELVPYRKPRFFSVILHALTDKCLSVLWRAVIVAAPTGLLIFTLGSISIGGESLILHISSLLDPIGRVMGVDGVILLAFILGLPANEIIIPAMLMIYSMEVGLGSSGELYEVASSLLLHGWTLGKAVCVTALALFHSPCTTSLITVYKETGSRKCVFLAFLIPSAIGIILCISLNAVFGLFA